MTTETSDTPSTQAIEPTKIELAIGANGSMISDSTLSVGDIIGGYKTVQNDEVHGDKVMRDKVVINEAPKLRIPLQRPPRAEHFQDRKEELAQLLMDLQPGRVVTLCGPGGIGKSALAAQAVWHLAPDSALPPIFPDGIIFHSFYGRRQIALALEHIAYSYGEEIRPTPKEAAQRALAGRCALLLLDGVEEADDLPSLLDIRDQCCVLLTSRTRKDAEATLQDIKPLSTQDAILLLQAWGGKYAASADAARRICQLIGRLPLALRLVGRYLVQNQEEANDYVGWLEETPLHALALGKRQSESIPLLLERSLAQVNEGALNVMSVIGVLALAPFTWETIAETLLLSERETRQWLGELIRFGLLIKNDKTFEATHALIHTYARERLSPSADTVNRLAVYHQQRLDAAPDDFAYLNALRPHVMSLLHTCKEQNAWDAASSLAWSIEEYLDLQGHWTDRILAITVNLAAAQATKNRQAEGALLANLGLAYADLGEVEQAIHSYQKALTIAKEIGDRKGESTALGNLGNAHLNLGHVKEKSIDYYLQSITISQEIGDRRSQGIWLGNLGFAYAELGLWDEAKNYYQQALAIAQEIGDRRNQGNWLGKLGSLYHNLGHIDQSIDYSQQALTLSYGIGDLRNQSFWLGNLGLAYATLGETQKARQYWKESLKICDQIKSPHASTVRRWLELLKNPP